MTAAEPNLATLACRLGSRDWAVSAAAEAAIGKLFRGLAPGAVLQLYSAGEPGVQAPVKLL